jgi:hypothetical protein
MMAQHYDWLMAEYTDRMPFMDTAIPFLFAVLIPLPRAGSWIP